MSVAWGLDLELAWTASTVVAIRRWMALYHEYVIKMVSTRWVGTLHQWVNTNNTIDDDIVNMINMIDNIY